MGKRTKEATAEYADKAKGDYRPVKSNDRHMGDTHPPDVKKVDHGVKLNHKRNPDPEPQKNPGPAKVANVRSSVHPWKPKGRRG